MLVALHAAVVLLAVFTGKLYVASAWTSLLCATLAAVAIHLKQPRWRLWSLWLGALAVLYAAYTVSYVLLDTDEMWTFASHMAFVGWTGPLALIDAPVSLFAVFRQSEAQAKRALLAEDHTDAS